MIFPAHIREAKEMIGSQYDRPVRDSKLGLVGCREAFPEKGLMSCLQTFHTDTFCDILAMQTLNCPAKGGRHILTSGHTIYNELAVTRPDLLKTLADSNWTFDP